MKKIEIESMERRNQYRVPDSYFSDLRNNLTQRVSEQAAADSVTQWQRVRGMFALVGTFGVLVLIATVGYYFTGYQATLSEAEQNDPLLGYHVTIDEIESINSALADPERTLQLAEAANEYLETYGYGYIDSDTYETINGN